MTSKKLFLVVPGLRGTEQKWEPLLSKLKQDPDISEGQHAEWVFWPHGKRPWSFGRAFEPSVEQIRSLFETTRLVSPWRFDGLPTRNRKFESTSLQRRVGCELGSDLSCDYS